MIIESFPPRLPEPIRALYPFRTRYLLVDESPASPAGGMMSFVDEGPETGPPLLLLHGNLTWSFLFRDLIADFDENVLAERQGAALTEAGVPPAA